MAKPKVPITWKPVPRDPEDPRHQVGYWATWAREQAANPAINAMPSLRSPEWDAEIRYAGRRRRSLYAYADRSNVNGCWPWHGPYFMAKRAGQPAWYGSFSWHNYGVGAHRASWMIHNGPIPCNLTVLPQLVVDHLCCVPWCIQPLHLDLVPIGHNNWRVHNRLPHQTREATSFRQPTYEERYRIRPMSAQNEKWSHLRRSTTPAGR